MHTPHFAAATPPMARQTDSPQAPAHLRQVCGAGHAHYRLSDGRWVLDATAGDCCINAGHCHPGVSVALKAQIDRLDSVPGGPLAHDGAHALAAQLAAFAPDDLNHVHLAASGTAAVADALKLARRYCRARGSLGRRRLIVRERDNHHGRWLSEAQAGDTERLPHTHDLFRCAFARGQPSHGAERADVLTSICALHRHNSIAAVVIEPVAVSAGVLPPPVGYLQRLRMLCDRYGILLIFDESATGFGRLGAAFAATRFGVLPDMLVVGNGLTNGTLPMGAVLLRRHVAQPFTRGQGPLLPFEDAWSASPMASAAALATLQAHRDEGLAQQAALRARALEDGLHTLAQLPGVVDVRNIGMLGAVQLAAHPGCPHARATAVRDACLARDVLVRQHGLAITLSPPLTATKAHIDRIVATLRAAILHTA